MITISNFGTGYKVKFSNPYSGQRGSSVRAKTVYEVHQIVDHYFVRAHDTTHCPSCKSIDKKVGLLRSKSKSKRPIERSLP